MLNHSELKKEIIKRNYKNIVGLKSTLTEEEYFYFLDCLPPIYFKNGFLLTEKFTTNNYLFCWEDKKGNYFCEIKEIFKFSFYFVWELLDIFYTEKINEVDLKKILEYKKKELKVKHNIDKIIIRRDL